MKKQVVEQIKKIVSKIDIKKRGTKEGNLQREEFRRRWGIRPEGLDFGSVRVK